MSKLNFSFSKKKLLLLGFLFVILLVIPLTVYLVQQQQQTQSRANPTTTLAFSPAEQTATVGGKVSFDIFISPGENKVNFAKIVIKFDSTKIQATDSSFVHDPASGFPILQDPAVGADGNNLSFVLNIDDLTKAIAQDTKLGTVTFEVVGASADIPAEISFDASQIQIRSVGGADALNKNMFLSGSPASVTIVGEEEPTGTPTPSQTPIPTETLTPSPTSTDSGDTTPSANQAPVCESLAIDREATGDAPLSITFTAVGTDTDGTISKATFNFGDGPVTDVTTSGGIGTSSVSLPLSHTYSSSGTFTATAVLTDDGNGVSDSTSCNVTITVTGGDVSPTITPLPDTGPNNVVVGVGALGGILFLIGALLFFAL